VDADGFRRGSVYVDAGGRSRRVWGSVSVWMQVGVQKGERECVQVRGIEGELNGLQGKPLSLQGHKARGRIWPEKSWALKQRKKA
jgi:hypothetical protein